LLEAGMAKKPTYADAQLILRLYDLRREAELRKARKWWLNDFWPRSVEDFMKITQAVGAPENAWFRQGASYWGMTASFVLQGVLNENLFLRPTFSGEMFFLFAKVQPFLKEFREKIGDQEAFHDVEQVILRTKWGRERLKFLLKRVEIWREKVAIPPSAVRT
jgi:hypothetical protein